jgi:ribosomal protein S18 acetylase RimI-like enzyme
MIRKMTLDDVAAVSAAMARAFWDDPLQCWLLPDESTRLDRLERMFAGQARYSSIPQGECYTDDTCATGAFWAPPGKQQPVDEMLRAMEPLEQIVGEAIVRFRAAFSAMHAVHPVVPHYYLAGLGTDPPRQGEGLASRALQPVFERCDADAIPAYLESTKAENVGFYEVHGFRVTEEIEPPPDGPTLWCMWRDPGG